MYNLVTGTVPDGPWTITVTDSNGDVIPNGMLSLPPAGGGLMSLPDLPLGSYTIFETPKCFYASKVAWYSNPQVTGLEMQVTLSGSTDMHSVLFNNSYMPTSGQYTAVQTTQSTQLGYGFVFPPNQPIPIQAVFDAAIGPQNSPHETWLVLGKPTSIYLNLQPSEPSGTNVQAGLISIQFRQLLR